MLNIIEQFFYKRASKHMIKRSEYTKKLSLLIERHGKGWLPKTDYTTEMMAVESEKQKLTVKMERLFRCYFFVKNINEKIKNLLYNIKFKTLSTKRMAHKKPINLKCRLLGHNFQLLNQTTRWKHYPGLPVYKNVVASKTICNRCNTVNKYNKYEHSRVEND